MAKIVHHTEKDPRLGVEVAISYHGKIVFQHGYGKADIAADRPMTPRTPSGIGSITKQFTAAETMHLVAQHKLHLTDTLNTLLPREHWPAGVTVRDLLHHTSGLSSRWDRIRFTSDKQTENAIEDRIAEAHAPDKPGTTYTYNNNGYYLLGLIIQRITHHPWPSDIASLVHPAWPEATAESVICHGATGASEAKAYGADLSVGAQEVVPYPKVMADGSLCATAGQLLRWQRALRNGRIVPTSAYTTMTTASKPSIRAGTPYGMGLVVPITGLSVWHNGLMPLNSGTGFGYGAVLSFYTAPKIGIAVLATHGDDVPMKVARQIWRHIGSG